MYFKLISLSFFLSFFFNNNAWSSSDRTNCLAVSEQTCKIANSLGSGINLGNIFDAPYEGAWGEWFKQSYIDEISKNFNTVRLPVRWSNYASTDEKAIINKGFLKRIESIVNSFLKRNVNVIITMQHYKQFYGDHLHNGEKPVEPQVLLPRFLNIWNQLSLQFKDYPKNLLFEPLNEPHGKIGVKEWNYLISNVTEIIRQNDRNRILVFGPVNYNNTNALKHLKLPNDQNIISTIHIYEPFNFTHQGATWIPMKLPKGITCCNIYQTAKIDENLKNAKAWSIKVGRPLYIGEFGSIRNADKTSRLNYLKTNIALFKKYKFNWVYWNFSSDFGFYNSKTHRWELNALKILNPNLSQ